MGFKDNIKKLATIKENRIFLILVFWLISGLTIIQVGNMLSDFDFVFIGILVLLPSLAFLFFLYLLSFIRKKDIREIALWKLFGLFIISLPVMFLLFVILVILFLFSIVSYIFLTSWFILYGCYLIAKNLDERVHKRKFKALTRSTEYFGGTFLAIALLTGVITGAFILIRFDLSRPVLFGIFFVVGIIILIYFIVGVIYLIKGIFPAFLGIFFLLVVFYTFFLVFKVFLGLSGSGGDSSLTVQIALLVFDLFIIFYSVGTMLGSQAELLAEKLKFFSVDNILIFLIFSKTAYEFAANFPYDILSGLSVPYIENVVAVGSDLNVWKNAAVLVLFVILLIIIGSYEIHKYAKLQKQHKNEIENRVQELIKMDPSLGATHMKSLRKTRDLSDFYAYLKREKIVDDKIVEEMEDSTLKSIEVGEEETPKKDEANKDKELDELRYKFRDL